MNYETIIGLEVHLQLATKSKLFCGCSTTFTHKPNSNICIICTGQPGTLPVLNKQVLNYSIAAGLALNCDIKTISLFDRKSYFYPDLPKGYQISQFYKPYAENGYIDINLENRQKRIGINRIHIEEDAGKLIHSDIANESYVDFNRCSIPLIEIVSNPDMRSSIEACLYLEKLKIIMKYLNISDVSMELGSLRCDVNISIKDVNSEILGTKVEVKNLNSFKSISKAIEYEEKRQKSELSLNKKIIQETRLWDEARLMTKSMRLKEESKDYRYFPDPDLMPVIIEDELINDIKNNLPEFSEEKKIRFINQYNISEYDSSILVQDKNLSIYFEKVVEVCSNPKISCNWIITEVLKVINIDNSNILNFKISPDNLGKLIRLIDSNVISSKIAKELFSEMLNDDFDPELIVNVRGIKQLDDRNIIIESVNKVLKENNASIELYKKGRTNILGYLVGQVIKETQGKANPKIVNELIKEMLS